MPLEEKVKTKHSILLDLTLKTDKVIYDNLVFSSYNCTLINPKQAQCTQYQSSSEVISSNGEAIEVYNFESSSGEAFKIYELQNGVAHIEFTIDSSDTVYRYSFTSVNRIPDFTKNKGLFTTGPVEWDMTSLGQTL